MELFQLIVAIVSPILCIAFFVCFFVLCAHVARLLRTARHIQEKQLPFLSQQLEQMRERLEAIEAGKTDILR